MMVYHGGQVLSFDNGMREIMVYRGGVIAIHSCKKTSPWNR